MIVRVVEKKSAMPPSTRCHLLPTDSSSRRLGRTGQSQAGTSCVHKVLWAVGFLYLQLSTFTLIQWVREHSSSVRNSDAAAAPDVPPSPSPTLPDSVQGSSLGRSGGSRQRDRERGAAPTPLATEESVEFEEASADGAEGSDGSQLDGIDALKGMLETGARAQSGSTGGKEPNGPKKVSAWINSEAHGKFIGITPFFNPGRHQNKVDNFRRFRISVAAQGLQILCVELVFGEDHGFQLRGGTEPPRGNGAIGSAGGAVRGGGAREGEGGSADCDIVIQRRTKAGNTLWQKERLLNIALQNLPRSVDKVLWLDSDLIFLNDNWVPETAALLDSFPVVQPFGWMTYLPAGQGADYALTQLTTLPLGQGVGSVYHGAGLGIQSFPDHVWRSSFLLGHPGFAWAARREVMQAAGGFYDRSIIGGGDRILLHAFTGHYAGMSKKMPAAMADDIRAYGRKITPLVGPSNISYTPGMVLHIWHGEMADRDYTRRYQILRDNQYDPVRDVRVGPDGVLEWATQKGRLHAQVTKYFKRRKEGSKGEVEVEEQPESERQAARKQLSRPVRSYLGYHCRRADYRDPCKVAFQLWSDTVRFTQLQLVQKKLIEEQAAAHARVTAGQAAAAKRAPPRRSKIRRKRSRREETM